MSLDSLQLVVFEDFASTESKTVEDMSLFQSKHFLQRIQSSSNEIELA